MFCYLITFLNGHRKVVVSKNEIFSVDLSLFSLPDSQIVSVQMLNSDSVVVVD